MTFVNIFNSCLQKTYKARLLSKASVFYYISTFLALIIPLIFSYKTQGFWHKQDFYREKPNVQFKHHVLLTVETNKIDQPIIWSTFNEFNDNIQRYFRVVSIQHIEHDFDRDGIFDSFEAQIEVPVKADENVHSVKTIHVFDYRLFTYSSLQMEAIAFINYPSPLPGTELFVKGDLRLYQKEPLKHNGLDTRYNRSITEKLKPDQISFENILSSYSEQNVSASLQNVYYVWKTGKAIDQPFKISISIRYPEETILYRLGFWQVLKWAWVQYFSVLIISLYICHKIKIFVFQTHLFCTIVDSPIKPHQY